MIRLEFIRLFPNSYWDWEQYKWSHLAPTIQVTLCSAWRGWLSVEELMPQLSPCHTGRLTISDIYITKLQAFPLVFDSLTGCGVSKANQCLTWLIVSDSTQAACQKPQPASHEFKSCFEYIVLFLELSLFHLTAACWGKLNAAENPSCKESGFLKTTSSFTQAATPPCGRIRGLGPPHNQAWVTLAFGREACKFLCISLCS